MEVSKKELLKMKQELMNKTKIVTMNDRLMFIKRLAAINKAIAESECETFDLEDVS